MNKVKMFFIAAALVLTTAGVFAGKAKFAGVSVAFYNGNNALFTSATSSDLTTATTSGKPASIQVGTTIYGLYDDASASNRLYFIN